MTTQTRSKRRSKRKATGNQSFDLLREKIRKANQNPYIKALIYGPARVGKTSFIGSAGLDHRTSPILVLDFEGGTSSLRGYGDGVDILPISTWDEFNHAHEFLTSGNHPYKSLAVDSLTETHVYSLTTIVENAVQLSDRRDNSNQNDELTLEISDYGKSLWQMRKFVRAFRDLPMHVFYTALTKSILEPKEGWVRKPNVFGAFSEELVGLFDVVGFLYIAEDTKKRRSRKKDDELTTTEIKQSKRVLLLGNEPSIRCGIRNPLGSSIPAEINVGPDDGVTNLLDILAIES